MHRMAYGYRVFVCSNMGFAGEFTPVLAKHSKSFSLVDCIAVGVDRVQRNFETMRKQVEAWQRSELTDVTAKVVTYEVFVEANWKHRNISPGPCTTSTSSRVPRVPVADDLESLERVHLGKCICVFDLLCRVQPLVSNTRQLSGVQPNPPLELESVKRLDH